MRYLFFFTVFTINLHVFVICENYFFLSGLYLFTKTNFLASQSAHTDFRAISLFTICFAVTDLLFVLFFHLKQYVSCVL